MLSSGADDAGWMQLLVFIVVAALAALNSIIKARSRKLDLEDEQSRPEPPGKAPSKVPDAEVPPQSSTRQPGEPARPVRPRGPARRRLPARPSPTAGAGPSRAVQTVVTEIERSIPDVVQPEIEPQLPTLKPRIELDFQQLGKPVPEPLPRTPRTAARPTVKTVKKGPRPPYVLRTVPRLSTAADLRRAVLCYEILGKPVGLRHSPDHLIGL